MVIPFSVDVRISSEDMGLMKRLERAIDKAGQDVVKGVGYRTGQAIRLAAPKSGVDHPGKKLAQSIVTKPQGKYIFSVIVGQGLYRDYHLAQEFGFRPHWVSKKLHPEVASLGRGKKAVFVKKHTSFIEPSLRNIDRYIRREVNAQLRRHVGSA